MTVFFEKNIKNAVRNTSKFWVKELLEDNIINPGS